jgi:DNA replicative helicase MCM subunit Mcm2 (Cdc46/Mcm family)
MHDAPTSADGQMSETTRAVLHEAMEQQTVSRRRTSTKVPPHASTEAAYALLEAAAPATKSAETLRFDALLDGNGNLTQA